MTGDLAFTGLSSVASGGNGVRIVGADDTARLTGFSSNFTLKAPICLENVTVVKSGDRYITTKGYKFEIAEGTKCITETTDATTGEVTTAETQFKIGANPTSGTADMILSSSVAQYNILATGIYASGFNGTFNMTINSGTFTANVQLGNQWGDGTISGNLNLIVNGGTFNYGTVNFRNYQSGTGAKTLIYNNSMATASKTVSSTNFDYVVKSGNGGAVSITTQATATTAPTFTIKADKPGYEIKLNGVSVGFGEYSFTPTSTGTYTVEYVVQ